MSWKKPETKVSGTKIFIYGLEGTRKTRTALTFPKLAYIDTDQGADDYISEFQDNIEMLSDATTFTEVNDNLDDIGEFLDQIETIVLDTDTKVYENQQHTAMRVAENRAKKNNRLAEGEGLSPKEWGIINMNHDKMLHKLFEYKKDGKIIICVAEAKEQKESFQDNSGNTHFRTVGYMPNTAKGIKYDFDIILEMVKDEKTGKFKGAKVHKDRTGTIEEGEIVENPSYEIWKDAIERKKQGNVKEAKRNMEEDIDRDMKSFDFSDVEKIDQLKSDIDEVINSISQDEDGAKLKSEIGKKFKEILQTTNNYKQIDDVKLLQRCLDSAKEIANVE